MKVLKTLQELDSLVNNSVEYNGKLTEYQQVGLNPNTEKHHIKYQQYKLNKYQNLLYKRALYGLKAYDEKELETMHDDKKERIKKVNKRAQRCINLFKQEKMNLLCDKLYNNFLNRSKLAKNMLSLEKNIVDPNFINRLDLKSLGIRKEHIIERLMNNGILPKDFYELKQPV